MLIIQDGDLLRSDATFIAHGCNCLSTMGAGIALQIKNQFPKAYEADKRYHLKPRKRMGRCSFAYIPETRKFIFNLYIQFAPGKARSKEEQDERYEAIKSALRYLMIAAEKAEEVGYPVKIGMPYKIAAGLAGGDWTIIQGLLEEASNRHNRNIYLYRFPPSSKPKKIER